MRLVPAHQVSLLLYYDNLINYIWFHFIITENQWCDGCMGIANACGNPSGSICCACHDGNEIYFTLTAFYTNNK